MKIATLTGIAFRTGAHSRHKEMARELLLRRNELTWIGPSLEDVQDIEGMKYAPLKYGWLRTLPLIGKMLGLVFSARFYKNILDDSDVVFVTSQYEAFAIGLVVRSIDTKSIFFDRSNLIAQCDFLLGKDNRATKRIGYMIKKLGLTIIYKSIFRNIDRVVAQTPSHRQDLLRVAGGGMEGISIVPNNINTSWMNNSPSSKIRLHETQNGEKLIGFVGNFSEPYWHIKGMPLLLRILVELKKTRLLFRLVIIGDGPIRTHLQEKIGQILPEHEFEFVGRVDNAVQYIKRFDLLLVTSQFDMCPNVVLEGINEKVPVLATNIAAHSYLLGVEEYLISVDSAEDFAGSIVEILSDSSVANNLQNRQFLHADKFDFDWGGVIFEQFLLEFESSLNRPQSSRHLPAVL